MKEYPLVVVLWDDHVRVTRQPIPKDVDTAMETTMSVGILFKQTKKVLVLVSDIERYGENFQDDYTYMVIYRGTVVSIKEFGKVKLRKF